MLTAMIILSFDSNMISDSFGAKSFCIPPGIMRKQKVKCARVRLRFRWVRVKPIANAADADADQADPGPVALGERRCCTEMHDR